MDNELHSDYIKRINKVFYYINENLDSDLSLLTLSKIAFFSPYHFHRIFKIITGETLNEYVIRRRIERAAAELLHNDKVTVTGLSEQLGFNENSSFTRAFKKFYGVSPSKFRKQNPDKHSKIRQVESKIGQKYQGIEDYVCNIINLKKWIDMKTKIEIKEMPEMELAYVTSIGEQNIGKAYDKLMRWARPQGLFERKDTKVVTIYHDSFKITEPGKIRMSACVTVNGNAKIEGEVGLTKIEAGKFIKGSFEITQEEFGKSWSGLFVWMNENGYKKADRNPFEIYHNDFREHPEKKSIVDFCIPVE